MLKSYRPVLLLLMIVSLLALACSTLAGGNEPPVPDAPPAGDAPAPEQPAAPAPAAAGDAGPEVLDFSDPNALVPFSATSYYLHLNYSFNGTAADGSAVSGTMLMDVAYAIGPSPATSITVRGEGNAAVPHTEITDTADTDYIYTADYGCLSFSSDEFSNPYEGWDDIAFLGTAQRVEVGVEINGIVTDRYELTSANFPPDAFEETEYLEIQSGSLYRSRSGQMIRVELHGVGISAALSGDPNLQGQITYLIDFNPISDPIEIVPPEACIAQPDGDGDQSGGGASFSGYPMMDDANEVASFNDQMISYTTNYTLDEIIAYYKAELAAQNYEVISELSLAGNAVIRFSKDGVVINLAVTPLENGQHSVVIVRE